MDGPYDLDEKDDENVMKVEVPGEEIRMGPTHEQPVWNPQLAGGNPAVQEARRSSARIDQGNGVPPEHGPICPL
jgi:hypothetical protein